MTTPYVPIACEVYDALESFAVQRTVCQIEFLSASAIESVQSRIVDVYSRNKEEFIKIEDGRDIRLDHLRAINGTPVGGSCDIE